jgi:hypothetical protein
MEEDADDTCESLYRIVRSRAFPDIYPNLIATYRCYPDMTRRTAVSYFLDAWEDVWLDQTLLPDIREQIGNELRSLIPPGGVDPGYHSTLLKEFGIVLE